MWFEIYKFICVYASGRDFTGGCKCVCGGGGVGGGGGDKGEHRTAYPRRGRHDILAP